MVEQSETAQAYRTGLMTSQIPSPNELIRISIFHTNDMHGHLEAMARLSAYARNLREDARAEGRQVFFWDAGDAADRRRQICSVTKGAAFPPILNAMGYTLQAMGNAISLAYGPQAMAEVAARSDFPILAANCRDGDGPLVEGLKELARIPLPGGMTMGVVGLTAPWGRFYQLFGLRFPDSHEIARRLVTQLRDDGVSLVVVLSHLGLEDDRRLANEVDGIDLIIGGHSHDRLDDGEERNGVLIAQAGAHAKAIGRVDLTLDPKRGRLVSRTAKVLDVPEDGPADPGVLAAISAAEQEVEEIMAQTVGEIAAPLDLDYFRECGVGNLAADALRARMDADIAMVASGQFRRPLEAGTLTLGQLDAACFSTANPWLSEVRGDQILEALERGLDPAITQVKHPSYRGAPIGIPQISGMLIDYAINAATKPRVRRVLIQGHPIDPDRCYRLAHTDAESMPEVGYLVLDDGQIRVQEVPTILKEVIADYVRRHSPLPSPQRGRWMPISSP
jgi:5'-nucleotidase